MLSFENMSHTGLGPQVTTVSQLSSLWKISGMNSSCHCTVVPKGADVPASLPSCRPHV